MFEFTKEQVRNLLKDNLEERLPHGCGINGKWKIFITKDQTKARASNVYSAMNETGMYCHTYAFTVTYNCEAGTFVFDRLSIQYQRKCCGIQLRDYLEETLSELYK